jgi:hypothetical protein
MKAINRTVQIEDIHPQWYFTREDLSTSLELSRPLPVLHPLVIQEGRPRGGLGLGGVVRPTNTRREPSSFEIPPSSAPPLLISLRSIFMWSIRG